MRHYFPGVDLDALTDEAFAEMTNDAVWLHGQIMASEAMKTALGMVGMVGGAAKK